MTNRPRKHLTRRERRLQNERTGGTAATLAAPAAGTSATPAEGAVIGSTRPASPTRPSMQSSSRSEAMARSGQVSSSPGLAQDMRRAAITLVIVGIALAVTYFMLQGR